MWNSGFYNALLKNGVYDRKYNGDHYSDALSFVVGNGVVCTEDGNSFVVESVGVAADASTYALVIRTGWAWIRGKWVHNDTDDTTSVVGKTASGTPFALNAIPMCQRYRKRIDRIFLRHDKGVEARSILPVLRSSDEFAETATNIPECEDTDSVLELCIAEVHLDYTGTTPIVDVYDTRNDGTLCGWMNGYFGDNYVKFTKSVTKSVNNYVNNKTGEFNRWFEDTRNDVATVTLLKPLRNTVTADTIATTFSIGIAEYDPELDILDVYTNGIYEKPEDDYTIDTTNKTVTFTSEKQVGAVIDFVVTKSLDARFYDNPDEEMIASVESRFTDIYSKLASNDAKFAEVNYVCTGVDDNKAISDLVLAFLRADTGDRAKIKINVRGTFGATSPAVAQVSSSTTSPEEYARWFNFGASSTRQFTLDFANCSPITLPLSANSKNVIFYGSNQRIENCVLKAGTPSDVGTIINGTYGRGVVEHVGCRYSFTAESNCGFTRHGRFENCEVSLFSKTGNATAFYAEPAGGVIEVSGGIYWLYSAATEPDYGVKFAYHTTSSDVANNTIYDGITIIDGASVPTYLPDTQSGTACYLRNGIAYRQNGTVFRSVTNAGGYIRSRNVIAQAARTANDSIDTSTDSIIEGTIHLSRGKGTSPFV